MDVVIVESPAKAKTINKYLGSNFRVLASYGHVRDLPAKNGSVKPEENFAMSWEVAADSKKRVDEIAEALRGAENLFLATDPDREGEAISWHVKELLQQRNALDNVVVKRVVFHEITKNAVLDAISNPRDVNQDLVEAYLARRALDYLVGFSLSPVLWRKLPGSRSAGRVQSVALRLICERESEIDADREHLNEASRGLYFDELKAEMVRISKGRKEGEPELFIPSDKFNRGIGKYAGKRYTVTGEPFEGSDEDWDTYLNEILPTDADEKLLMEEYMAPGVEWIQYREWKGK